jgi:hypothetical protein
MKKLTLSLLLSVLTFAGASYVLADKEGTEESTTGMEEATTQPATEETTTGMEEEAGTYGTMEAGTEPGEAEASTGAYGDVGSTAAM